ncbi:MAG TPA: TRAP transporter small permease [Paenalcaligenes sp.]|nr:TRAP transporter small permease [Paenalcaligenes sp.]
MSSPKKPKTRIETALAVFSLATICLISLANVIVRYTTEASFAFTEEFSVFLMVVLTFAGGAMAARSNENIRISFLEHKVGPVGRRILYTVQWIISLIVLVAVTWYGALLALEEYEWDSLSAGLGYPTWIYLIWLPILSIAIMIRLTQNWWQRMRHDELEDFS